jgi:hypothetical protein
MVELCFFCCNKLKNPGIVLTVEMVLGLAHWQLKPRSDSESCWSNLSLNTRSCCLSVHASAQSALQYINRIDHSYNYADMFVHNFTRDRNPLEYKFTVWPPTPSHIIKAGLDCYRAMLLTLDIVRGLTMRLDLET